MRRLVFLLLLQLFPLPGWGISSAPDVSQAYFYDEQNSLTIDAIDTVPFTPYVGELSLGFRSGSAWVRLEIAPHAMQSSAMPSVLSPNPFIVRAGPHHLDEIILYEKTDGKWTHTTAGDLYRKPLTECLDDFHCFRLQGNSQQPNTVYLRINSTSLLTLETEVAPFDTLIFSSLKRVKKISVSLTIACALLVFGLIFFLRYRSTLLHIFCWFQVTIILFICARTGILAQLLPDLPADVIDKIGNITFTIRVYLHALLGREFIAQYQTSVIYKKLMVFISVICIASILAIPIGYTNFSVIISTVLFLLTPLIQIYGVVTTPAIPKTFRTILLVAYAFFFILVTTGWMAGSGLISPSLSLLTLRGIVDVRLNGIVTSFFLFWLILLEQNIRDKAKSRDMIKLRLDAAEAQANEEKLVDRNTLIDMLTHELKNPLATIKFATTSVKRNLINDPASLQRFKHIDLCIARMNKLIEHVARSSKFDRAHELDAVESIAASPMIHDLIEEYAENQRFILNIEDELFFIANQEILTVIFENLISNAYKYADTASPIMINMGSATESNQVTGESDKFIYFAISNMAGRHGVPDEKRLFERYYRHSHAQSVSGLGIGLSLVKAAAKKIHASVNYRYEDGRITFTVRIPN